MITALMLLGALALLGLGANFLVTGASTLAKRLGLSSFFIGMTIVGFGTSTPELFTAVTAALRGKGDLAVGNVVGANILNIAFILGVTAMFVPIVIKLEVVKKEIFLVIIASLAPFAVLLSGGTITRVQGALMLAILLVYIVLSYWSNTRQAAAEAKAASDLEKELGVPTSGARANPILNIFLVIGGVALLGAGAALLVDAAVSIARSMGISELVIGLTIVAWGTTTPELFTCLVAALRRQSDVGVGNALGSCLFNIFGILAITCLIQPQPVSQQTLMLDAPVMLVCALALLPVMFKTGRIGRLEGGTLLAIYAGYLALLIFAVPRWFPTVLPAAQ